MLWIFFYIGYLGYMYCNLVRMVLCRNYVRGLWPFRFLYDLYMNFKGEHVLFCDKENGLCRQRRTIVFFYLLFRF